MTALGRIDLLRFGSLKLRMAALYAALFAAVLATILIIVGQGIGRFAEDATTRDLAANARVFDEILVLRARQMRSSTDVLSRDFGFREAVATNDRPTLSSALDSLRSRSGSNSAFVVGYDATLTGSSGDAMPNPMELWNALDEGETYGVIRQGDKLALAAASPIKVPDLVGWLVVTQPLDNSELARLVGLAAIDLEASVVRRADLPALIAHAPTGKVFERSEGERFLYRVSELPTLEDELRPQLVLKHSLTRSLAEYSAIRWLLAALAGAGLLLVVALSWRVAKTMTAPLRKLDEATRLISAGERVEVPVETNDEIGRLANSFNVMIEAIDEREKRIVHVGLHDGLTNLPNRKLFTEQLTLALARRKDNQMVMVVYADLDDFKVVNDTLGHPAGDALLRDVAKFLRKDLSDATVARLGGDEFAILIEMIPTDEDLNSLAHKVQSCFMRIIDIEGQKADCSASLGIAVAPSDGDDGVTLMKHADLALYRAKNEGKSCYHFFEPSLDEQARQRRQMELDLRRAISDGEFELFFQPLYSLTEEKLKGFEALIRWNHPKRGMVPPVEFIPLAEETGLILPIGEWVIREACHQASQWDDDLAVAVNISPKQFSSPDLVAKILNAIAASGIAPRRLELEITESIFIAQVEKTMAILHKLRDLGVRIALDDFGTGYSSLSYLRSFPFDKVKIDRSFVTDLANGENGHAIIRAITTLAEALGMETLAEGVEDIEQLDILRREGCRSIQGFLLSRPMSAQQVQSWASMGSTDIALAQLTG
ncbi:EAL domain-containing protein [Qipengyuania gaetbuli]|uniref:bifunctional diguanylate cyclase/phosphodiesterase n=1 Tax=Qipengyuania gaetbuli TaxID=266952 RepID=UPI001C9963A7|nr:EAL domain-containing protein [Qipengyuania gaetbuli]MBY6015104.1 EAL domain-containing protein [Qipengyuania gaetbuli]